MLYWRLTFHEWYNDNDREEWYSDNYDKLKTEWEILEKIGVHTEIIARVFDNIIIITKEDYDE